MTPTWKTFGALTRDARAEERVAEKIPAVMRGLKPDTTLMTFSTRHSVTKPFSVFLFQSLMRPYCNGSDSERSHMNHKGFQ